MSVCLTLLKSDVPWYGFGMWTGYDLNLQHDVRPVSITALLSLGKKTRNEITCLVLIWLSKSAEAKLSDLECITCITHPSLYHQQHANHLPCLEKKRLVAFMFKIVE